MMDPFSVEGELVNIHSAFHQGQFQKVVDFDTSSFSESNELPARILKLRARIAQGDARAVAAEISKEASNSPDLAAVKAYAQFSAGGDKRAQAQGIEAALQLATSAADNFTVQILCGTILAQQPGKEKDALALLSKHTGSLDAVALTAQIQLQLNRPDLAAQQVTAARSWGQDSLLVNMAEAWLGMRQGGREKYQSAFYVYEELATAMATTSPRMHVGQAVAEMLLGRLPEAEAALQQAMETAPQDKDVLALDVVLSTILGRDTKDALTALKKADPNHVLLADLARKDEAFAAGMSKYSPKIEVDMEA